MESLQKLILALTRSFTIYSFSWSFPPLSETSLVEIHEKIAKIFDGFLFTDRQNIPEICVRKCHISQVLVTQSDLDSESEIESKTSFDCDTTYFVEVFIARRDVYSKRPYEIKVVRLNEEEIKELLLVLLSNDCMKFLYRGFWDKNDVSSTSEYPPNYFTYTVESFQQLATEFERKDVTVIKDLGAYDGNPLNSNSYYSN